MSGPGEARARLAEALMAGARLAAHLEDARAALQPLAPFDGATLAAADRNMRLEINNLLFTFQSAEDLIANRIVRQFLILAGAYSRRMWLRDGVNALERAEVIASADKFMTLHELRNQLTHDYPLSLEKQARRLNATLEAADGLLAVYESLRAHALANGFVGEEDLSPCA